MATRGGSSLPCEPHESVAVFVDSNLDTHIAMLVSTADTVADLKRIIIAEHALCFPHFGEITVQAVKVKRKGAYYHLSDSMLVRSAFNGVKGAWFLRVDFVVREIKHQEQAAENFVNENEGWLDGDHQLRSAPLQIVVADSLQGNAVNMQLDGKNIIRNDLADVHVTQSKLIDDVEVPVHHHTHTEELHHDVVGTNSSELYKEMEMQQPKFQCEKLEMPCSILKDELIVELVEKKDKQDDCEVPNIGTNDASDSAGPGMKENSRKRTNVAEHNDSMDRDSPHTSLEKENGGYHEEVIQECRKEHDIQSAPLSTETSKLTPLEVKGKNEVTLSGEPKKRRRKRASKSQNEAGYTFPSTTVINLPETTVDHAETGLSSHLLQKTEILGHTEDAFIEANKTDLEVKGKNDASLAGKSKKKRKKGTSKSQSETDSTIQSVSVVDLPETTVKHPAEAGLCSHSLEKTEITDHMEDAFIEANHQDLEAKGKNYASLAGESNKKRKKRTSKSQNEAGSTIPSSAIDLPESTIDRAETGLCSHSIEKTEIMSHADDAVIEANNHDFDVKEKIEASSAGEPKKKRKKRTSKSQNEANSILPSISVRDFPQTTIEHPAEAGISSQSLEKTEPIGRVEDAFIEINHQGLVSENKDLTEESGFEAGKITRDATNGDSMGIISDITSIGKSDNSSRVHQSFPLSRLSNNASEENLSSQTMETERFEELLSKGKHEEKNAAVNTNKEFFRTGAAEVGSGVRSESILEKKKNRKKSSKISSSTTLPLNTYETVPEENLQEVTRSRKKGALNVVDGINIKGEAYSSSYRAKLDSRNSLDSVRSEHKSGIKEHEAEFVSGLGEALLNVYPANEDLATNLQVNSRGSRRQKRKSENLKVSDGISYELDKQNTPGSLSKVPGTFSDPSGRETSIVTGSVQDVTQVNALSFFSNSTNNDIRGENEELKRDEVDLPSENAGSTTCKISVESLETNNEESLSKTDFDTINFVDYFIPKSIQHESVISAQQLSSGDAEPRKQHKHKAERKRKLDIKPQDLKHLQNSEKECMLEPDPEDHHHDPNFIDPLTQSSTRLINNEISQNDAVEKTSNMHGDSSYDSKVKKKKVENNKHEPHHKISSQDKQAHKIVHHHIPSPKKSQAEKIAFSENDKYLNNQDSNDSRVLKVNGQRPPKTNSVTRNTELHIRASQGLSSYAADALQEDAIANLATSSCSTEETPMQARRLEVAVRKKPVSKLTGASSKSKKEKTWFEDEFENDRTPSQVRKKTTTKFTTLSKSKREKSLLSPSGTIFNHATTYSSEDEFENGRTPSPDSSSTSVDSDQGLDSLAADADSSAFRKKDETDGEILLSQSKKGVPLDSILRSSSIYKKAKVLASQSQAEHSESQPVEAVSLHEI